MFIVYKLIFLVLNVSVYLHLQLFFFDCCLSLVTCSFYINMGELTAKRERQVDATKQVSAVQIQNHFFPLYPYTQGRIQRKCQRVSDQKMLKPSGSDLEPSCFLGGLQRVPGVPSVSSTYISVIKEFFFYLRGGVRLIQYVEIEPAVLEEFTPLYISLVYRPFPSFYEMFCSSNFYNSFFLELLRS